MAAVRPGRRAPVHVVVTGAAGGIGRAVAEAFAQGAAGAPKAPGTPDIPAGSTALTLVDVDRDGLEAAAMALDADLIQVDLTSPDGPGEAVERAWAARDGVDVLVNAAGIYPSLDMIDVHAEAGEAAEAGAQQWDRIFALNTRAPALATAALARLAVAASRPASVVNISSGAALRARPGGGPYAASKAALEMATRAAALELGPHGIRVNAVSPGFVAVGSDCNPVAPEYAAAVSENPLGRPGTPQDVARAVRWIASDEAEWITGEILRVDGGSGTGAGHLPRLWPPRSADGPTDVPEPRAAGPAGQSAPQSENEREGNTV